VKNAVLLPLKLLLFDIRCSIFNIQNAKQAKSVRLKGEGYKLANGKKQRIPALWTRFLALQYI